MARVKCQSLSFPIFTIEKQTKLNRTHDDISTQTMQVKTVNGIVIVRRIKVQIMQLTKSFCHRIQDMYFQLFAKKKTLEKCNKRGKRREKCDKKRKKKERGRKKRR